MNQRAVRKAVGYRQEILKTFVVPGIVSALMAAFAWAVYEALLMVTASPRISVIPAIILAALFYFVVLLVFRVVSEEELRSFPKGSSLVKLAKRFHLM